jgi:hypothetical protein
MMRLLFLKHTLFFPLLLFGFLLKCHPHMHAEEPYVQQYAFDHVSKNQQEMSKTAEEKNIKKSQEEMPLKLGNLSLPPSQQPGPLVGFGENIVDKGQIQFFLFGDQYKKRKGYFIDLVPAVLYGFTDQLSAFVNLPIAARYKERDQRSAGLKDAFVQLEYAFYTANHRKSIDQATLVGNVTFPTGSFTKNPQTGFGSPSFFIGSTYNRTAIDWFYFGSLGTVLTTWHSDNKPADQYMYELGFGRNIPSPRGWIFAWMMEIDGTYASKDMVKGKTDPNSGGNMLFFTPSLWFSSEKMIIQLGVGGVLSQHLYGNQSRFTHQIVLNFGWSL